MNIIYSTPDCGKCKQLGNILEEKGIPFKFCYDINEFDKNNIPYDVPQLVLDEGDGKPMSMYFAYQWANQQ